MGGGQVEKVLLYEGTMTATTGNSEQTLTLNDDINNYMFLLFSDDLVEPDLVVVYDFIARTYINNYHYIGTNYFTNSAFHYVDATHIKYMFYSKGTYGWYPGLVRIYGIK